MRTSAGQAAPDLTLPHFWSVELTQEMDHFGWSVSGAGDVNGDGYSDAIVGAPDYGNHGRALLFLGSPQSLGTVAAWTVDGAGTGTSFGAAVCGAGDVNGDGFDDVIVAAPNYSNGQTGEGRVVLYLGSPNGLSSVPAWTMESDQAGAHLGLSVACAGDVNGDGYSDVIVGEMGAALVFLGSPSGLGATPAWTVSTDSPGDLFGSCVASAGDVNGDGYSDVIVGAPQFGTVNSAEGRALLYLGSSSGLATTAAWTATGNQPGAKFGTSVSTAGDVNGDGYADVIVGAPGYDGALVDQGRAYVYSGSPSGLSAQPMWAVSSDQASASFGFAVATAGDVNGDGYADVLVGAKDYDPSLETNAGAVFVYCGSPTGPFTDASDLVNLFEPGAGLGFSVAPIGDADADGYSDFIVGAPFHVYRNVLGNRADAGLAELWSGACAVPAENSGWHAVGGVQRAHEGASVASAGDVNGDGFSDVIVGAPFLEDSHPDEGRASVYLGGPGGPTSTPAWTAEGNQAGARFGASVAGAGDVNGDGYDDVIVGAPYYDVDLTDEGRVLVYLGSPTGLNTFFSTLIRGGQSGAHLGASVASAGDVNGDGYADIIVGAPGYNDGLPGEGKVFLFLGSAEGINPAVAWTAHGGQAGAGMGVSVASAGDVNGDGYSDVIIGVNHWDGAHTDDGEALVYLGSPAGLSPTPAWIYTGTQANGLVGTSVASAGDVNGDGYSDVIVGANHFDDWQQDEGEVFLFLGSATGLSAAPSWKFSSDQAGAELGISVASAGDVDHDGYSDVLVGAFLYDDGEADEGRVYLFKGTPYGLADQYGNFNPWWTGEGNQVGALYGSSVAAAGDVDGDGVADFLVGAPLFDGANPDEGQAFLYLGGAGGAPRPLRQLQPDGSAPIAALGKSQSTAARLLMPGTDPAGRGHVRMEWEFKPLGQSFGSSGHGLGPSLDTGPPGAGVGSVAPLDQLVSGLAADTPYRWRFRIRTDSRIAPYSRWYWSQANALTETDLRTGNGLVGVGPSPQDPLQLTIESIRPNPSDAAALISYRLPSSGRARLTIHDLQGRVVKRLLDALQTAGNHLGKWDGRADGGAPCPPGVYWVRLELAGAAVTRKLVRD